MPNFLVKEDIRVSGSNLSRQARRFPPQHCLRLRRRGAVSNLFNRCPARVRIREFLKQNPKGGVHHLGILAEDYNAGVAGMSGRGFKMVQSGRNGETRFAYFDVGHPIGTLMEIVCLAPAIKEAFAKLKRGQLEARARSSLLRQSSSGRVDGSGRRPPRAGRGARGRAGACLCTPSMLARLIVAMTSPSMSKIGALMPITPGCIKPIGNGHALFVDFTKSLSNLPSFATRSARQHPFVRRVPARSSTWSCGDRDRRQRRGRLKTSIAASPCRLNQQRNRLQVERLADTVGPCEPETESAAVVSSRSRSVSSVSWAISTTSMLRIAAKPSSAAKRPRHIGGRKCRPVALDRYG